MHPGVVKSNGNSEPRSSFRDLAAVTGQPGRDKQHRLPTVTRLC